MKLPPPPNPREPSSGISIKDALGHRQPTVEVGTVAAVAVVVALVHLEDSRGWS